MDEAVGFYFNLGFRYNEILVMLEQLHQIKISMRTLKRISKRSHMRRRVRYTDVSEVALFIQDQVLDSGGSQGHRAMHLKCVQAGFVTTQETVRLLLRFVDSEGVDSRSRNRLRRRLYRNLGSNFTWHIDSYDKLKPFGICINGAIGGCPRLI